MRYVDLHLHTHYSDGTDPPEIIIERAVREGAAAIAITDHDTVAGVGEAANLVRTRGIGFLGGVEISADFDRAEIHVVGLGIDPLCPRLLTALEVQRMRRQARIEQIVARLNALGICLDGEKLGGGMPLGATPGRMHVARGLVTLGYAASVQEAFDRYLNPGRPAHVPRSRPSCEQAIEVIHEANGLAFLAHPGIGAAARLLDRLLALSFDGLEAYHCKHSPGQVQEFTELARARGLLVAGGSDCHGGAKSEPELGKVRVPHKYYERICSVLEARGRPSH